MYKDYHELSKDFCKKHGLTSKHLCQLAKCNNSYLLGYWYHIERGHNIKNQKSEPWNRIQLVADTIEKHNLVWPNTYGKACESEEVKKYDEMFIQLLESEKECLEN